jgi:hypothetical protein
MESAALASRSKSGAEVDDGESGRGKRQIKVWSVKPGLVQARARLNHD